MPGKTLEEQVPIEVRLAAMQWRTPEDVAVLFVPYELQNSATNARRGRHWAKEQAETQTAHTAAMWAWNIADRPTNVAPVLVESIVFRGNSMDDDNAWTGLKSVRDYLFKGRLAPDDSPRYLTQGQMRFHIAPKWAGSSSWVVLLVRRKEEQP